MDDKDKADFRRAIRGHLAERPSVSQSPATILRHVRREYPATIADVESALAVLVALDHLKIERDPLGGAEKYYKATGLGIVAHERGE